MAAALDIKRQATMAASAALKWWVLKFFGAVHFDEHFELLGNDAFVCYFVLSYTSGGKTSQTDFIKLISPQ